MSLQFFPDLPGLTYGCRRTPQWNTLVQTAASGLEARQALWSAPKWEWELVYNYLHLSTFPSGILEWQTLAGFFNSVAGGAFSFFLRDPDDCNTTNQPIGTGDGSTTTFQLQRTLQGENEYVFGVDTRGSANYGPYTRPAALTPVAYVNGSPVSASFNTQTGQVTYSSAPANGTLLSATFSYLWLVRFPDDKIDFETLVHNVYKAGSVKMLQTRT